MKYVPNALTILRMFMVPAFAVLFFSSIEYNHIYALLIFLLAGFTDWLDGYLARKYDVVTVVGIVLDPLADKLMLLTALICLTYYGSMPIWILVIVLINETILILAGISMYFRKKKSVIPANKFGKMATVLFTIAVFMMIVMPNQPFTMAIMIIALFSKLISFSSYVIKYFKKHFASKA